MTSTSVDNPLPHWSGPQKQAGKKNPVKKNLIDEITEIASSRLNTKQEYLRNLSCATIAATVGPKYFIMTQKGKLYLNIFTLLIGGSGISDKTTALNLYEKIVNEYQKKTGAKILLPSKFTPEALVQELNNQAKKTQAIPEGIISSDEYTRMIKESKSREYLSTSLEFMAQLYSGSIDSNITIGRGYESVTEACVSFVSVTTFSFIEKITDEFWTQGNGVRIMYVVDDQRKYREPSDTEMENFWNYSIKDETAEIAKIVDKLEKIRPSGDPMEIELDGEARKLLGDYKKETEKKAHELFKDVFDYRANSYSRLFEFSLKKAGIHAIGRMAKTGSKVSINKKDAEFGISEARKSYENFEKIDELQKSRKKAGARITPKDEVYQVLKDQGTLSAKKICEKTDIPLPSVQRNLKQLAEEGLVEKTKETKGAEWKVI